MSDAIDPAELQQLLEQGADITILDVRRREDREDVEHPIPGAEWKDPEKIDEWCGELVECRQVIVYCVKGQHVGNNARDYLRSRGIPSRSVEGGIRAWEAFSKGSD